jgi:hypothetical protein
MTTKTIVRTQDSRAIEISLRKTVVIHAKRAAAAEITKMRRTESGRVVAISFEGADGIRNNLYMDEISRFGDDEGLTFVAPKRRDASAGVIGGFATWIVSSFGAPPAAAKALAASVLILLVTATKGAFCDMTADAAKTAILMKTP